MESVQLVGRGLHGGERCGVRLSRAVGPVRFRDGVRDVTIQQLSPIRLERGVRVGFESYEVELVEHLFAALAGMRVRTGISIEVTGGEIPLLDGAAFELAMAARALDPRPCPSPLWVRKDAEFEQGDSVYAFSVADETELRVEVDFPEVGRQEAIYDGTSRCFLEQIAPARTFGFRRDAEKLRTLGLARGIDPHVVLLLDDDGHAVPPSPEPEASELARHKLLDLMGDLYLYGGPPRGRIQAFRPGHANSHAAAKRALEDGILGPEPP